MKWFEKLTQFKNMKKFFYQLLGDKSLPLLDIPTLMK